MAKPLIKPKFKSANLSSSRNLRCLKGLLKFSAENGLEPKSGSINLEAGEQIKNLILCLYTMTE